MNETNAHPTPSALQGHAPRTVVLTSGVDAKFQTMLEIQDGLNAAMGDAWSEATFENPGCFDLVAAIAVECGEAIDHLKYKWWNNGAEPDHKQFQMEIIDIAHFLLGITILRNRIAGADVLPLLMEALDNSYVLHESYAETDKTHCISYVKRILYESLKLEYNQRLDTPYNATLKLAWRWVFRAYFASLQRADFDHFFNAYIGKAVLNKFRNDHGAKKYGVVRDHVAFVDHVSANGDDPYLKIWFGREDNEILQAAIKKLNDESNLTRESINSILETAYSDAIAWKEPKHPDLAFLKPFL